MIYWNLNQIPELQGLDKNEALQVWRAASRESLKDGRYWLCFLPAGALAGIGSLFGLLGAAIGGGIGGGLSAMLSMNVIRPHAAEIVRQRQSSSFPPQ